MFIKIELKLRKQNIYYFPFFPKYIQRHFHTEIIYVDDLNGYYKKCK